MKPTKANIMKTVKTKNSLMVICAVFFLFLTTLVSCKKSSSHPSDSASATIKITDAPIDDASVRGARPLAADWLRGAGPSVQR